METTELPLYNHTIGIKTGREDTYKIISSFDNIKDYWIKYYEILMYVINVDTDSGIDLNTITNDQISAYNDYQNKIAFIFNENLKLNKNDSYEISLVKNQGKTTNQITINTYKKNDGETIGLSTCLYELMAFFISKCEDFINDEIVSIVFHKTIVRRHIGRNKCIYRYGLRIRIILYEGINSKTSKTFQYLNGTKFTNLFSSNEYFNISL